MDIFSTLKEIALRLDRSKFSKGLFWSFVNSNSISEFLTIRRFLDNPIFIGGCGRSGTTLMLSLISSQPGIVAIPDETYAFASIPEEVIDNVKSLEDGPRYVDQFLRFAKEADKAVQGKDKSTLSRKRVAEKTPSNTHFYNNIIKYFDGNVKIINMVRDGRDVVTSKHPSDPDNYYISPKRWINSVRAGLSVEEKESVITVRYEDLVKSTSSTMKKVCNHCSINFVRDKIKKYPSTSQFRYSKAWFGDVRPVSDNSVGRWKEESHAERVGKLMKEKHSKEILKKYEYIN